MTDDRKGGIALIAATIALCVTMILHPTGHQLLRSGTGFHSMAMLVLIAHTLAEISLPIFFLGALALTRRLASPDRTAIGALVLYGFGLIAGMIAAAASGYVAPALATHIVNAPGGRSEVWEAAFAYNGAVNQAFARIFVVASSAAILLWSLAIMKTRTLPRSAGVYGAIAGVTLICAVAPGFLKLNVHGFGLTVLVEGAWFIMVGTAMVRRGPVQEI